MTSKRLRIVTFGHSYIIAMNRALVREVAHDPDFDVTVVAPESYPGDLRSLTIDPEPAGSPLKIVGLPIRLGRSVHLYRYRSAGLERVIREGNYDLLHAWTEPYTMAGWQIARAVGPTSTRLLFRTAQSLVKGYPPPFAYFERKVLERAQGWIAGGELVFRAMLERGYKADAGRVLSLAVDTSAFRAPTPDERLAAQRSLGLEAPVLGYVGRLTEAKGIRLLLAALDQVEHPFSILFLGSGPEEERILAWAAQHPAHKVKVMLARHEEMPERMKAVDILVAPSQSRKNWREQFGRMLVEAFASGSAVIGSDSGECPFVIGDAGVVVPEADVAAWTREIQALLGDPARRAELARRGLARVGRYSTRELAERYRAFYREVAARPLTGGSA